MFLTGQGSQEVAVKALKNGASDYLVKSKLDSDMLKRSVQYAISKVNAEVAYQVKERMQGVLEMAGAICHELTQPLQAISGYAILMNQLNSETKSREDLTRKMIDQIERLKGLTHKLMSLTRYETMKYPGGGKIIDIKKSSTLLKP